MVNRTWKAPLKYSKISVPVIGSNTQRAKSQTKGKKV